MKSNILNSIILVALASLGATAAVSVDEKSTVISEVDSYQGLIDVAGKVDDLGTGVRFEKEVIMLMYEEGICAPDFEQHQLTVYTEHDSENIALVSADIRRVDKEFISKFELNEELPACPTAIVVKQRSRIDRPEFTVVPYDPSKQNSLTLGVMQSQEFYVGTVNDYTFNIVVMYKWHNDPEKVFIRRVAPGKEIWMKTYRTTELIAKSQDGPELQRMRVTSHALFTVANRFCNIEDCGIVEREEVEIDDEELKSRDRNDKFRLNNNVAQPRSLPKFTEVGFDKVRVPDDVWDAIVTYYNHNKEHPKIERWNKGNVYTNNLEAPSYMVNLPESGPLKPFIFNGIKPILEEWSGVELVPTACYGIRAYTNGSWLSNHVDTRSTHAVSVIINVDQEVTDPWPLMIYDHAGNDHNITMAPRDMVLYESATCVHGRPSIFNGKFYANMFVHYKPKDSERWIQE